MTAAQEDKLDFMWRQMAHQRFRNKSVISGKPAEDVHHFYGRRNRATRWYLPNAIPLTHEEHMRLHGEETEAMEATIIEILGVPWFENLRMVSNKIAKYIDFQDVCDHLDGQKEHYLKIWYV